MTHPTFELGHRPDTLPGTPARARRGSLRRRWPTLAGIGLAGLVAFDLSSGSQLAPVLAASGLVYLATAALRTPAAAWPVFLGTFVVITAASVMAVDVAATWILLGVAGLFLGYGLRRGAVRPADGLPRQAIAMAGFGLIAVITLIIGGELGAYLVAAGLLGHAGWDVHHHRTNRVVVRSMAEFCAVLDVLIAVAMVIVITVTAG